MTRIPTHTSVAPSALCANAAKRTRRRTSSSHQQQQQQREQHQQLGQHCHKHPHQFGTVAKKSSERSKTDIHGRDVSTRRPLRKNPTIKPRKIWKRDVCDFLLLACLPFRCFSVSLLAVRFACSFVCVCACVVTTACHRAEEKHGTTTKKRRRCACV